MKENTENHLNILMQGISASASEFLQKPFSEERLKNIWQHVVRKALVTKHMAMPTEIASSCCKGANPTSNENDNLLNIKQEVTRDYKQALDEMPDAQLFFQQEDQSSYFYLDEKDNCDAVLCSTAPQLQQSPRLPTEKDYPDGSSSLTHGFSVACMKGDLDNDCFDDCDNFLHIKSLQGEDAADYNSTILNYLFDSKAKEDYFLNHDLDDPTLCADLQFDDLPDSLDNITLSSDLVDGDVISGLDTNQSLCKGFDCLDDEDSQAADGEVLLLAEIATSEKGRINARIGSQSIRIKLVNGSISRDIEESNSKSDSEQSWNKGSKISSGKSKKTKVDWTPELHRRFVQAVEQLGVDKAIPSKILELMAVKCLTRHNVASHLQKYRAHRKHLLTREAEAASWNHRRQREAAAAAAAARHDRHARPAPASRPPQRIQPRRAHAPAPLSLAAGPPPLHVWGHPTVEHAAMQFWPAWPMPACQLDAWGNLFYPRQPPVLRMPLAPISSVANMSVSPHADGKQASLLPPRETVNAAISEVLRNPCIALPLGLRPPSLESVVSELQRRGISMVPPAPF